MPVPDRCAACRDSSQGHATRRPDLRVRWSRPGTRRRESRRVPSGEVTGLRDVIGLRGARDVPPVPCVIELSMSSGVLEERPRAGTTLYAAVVRASIVLPAADGG